MSIYLAFFGKSQDFTTSYYNRAEPIQDFNTVIKDFDILESKTFTVDDIKNKEILSRYFFNIKGQKFCLLKLYSFAQAFSGNRIAGSIYGVGLLSENNINITDANLSLLRAAKDNFAKLSLDGLKFNKSNFKDDTDRIWKAIIKSNDGNLLDKVSTTTAKLNGSDGPVAFFVKNLFTDACKLNERISNQDTVYLSEDLDHLKRTQNKWGKDNFPIYWELDNQFVPYKEPVAAAPSVPATNIASNNTNNNGTINDPAKLRSELADSQYNNSQLRNDIKILEKKQKLLMYIIYGLAGMLLILMIYKIFFWADKKELTTQNAAAQENVIVETKNQNHHSLGENQSTEDERNFLNAIQYVNTFEVKKQIRDTTLFYEEYKSVDYIAKKYNIEIKNLRENYVLKCAEIKKMAPPLKLTTKLQAKPEIK